jgi:pheromone shutdown-related protein TraB
VSLTPSTEPDAAPPAPAPEHDDVHRLRLGDRELVLIGTAHISQESVDLVREIIAREQPDRVCIELDERRFKALSDKQRWQSLDLREVIRTRQLATLLVNLLLSSYQKRLGGQLGVIPGSELLAAAEAAKELGVPVELCDRDVRVTLRRAWGALSLWRKAELLSGLFAAGFETPELSEEELRRIRKKDVLNELMQQLGQAMPALKRVLIDERDAYLAHKIRQSEGKRLVAVVGAGHVEGMLKALQADEPVDLPKLDAIPPVALGYKLAGWSVPLAVIAAIAWIGMKQGAPAAGQHVLYWILATGVPSAVGAIAALAHPLTILSAFVAAPFTTLSPLIGVGHVTAFVQAYMVPPRIHELQSAGDDVSVPLRWWSSRLLRMFLVLFLTSIGGSIGAWVAGVEIARELF